MLNKYLKCVSQASRALGDTSPQSLSGSFCVPVGAARYVSVNGKFGNYKMMKAGSSKPGNHFP